MNKKGFTLVELIGVLVIIGLLLLVTATPILGQIRNQRGKLDDASARVLYSSATSYLDEHIANYPKKNGMTYYLSVAQLMDEGYLKNNYLETTEILEDSSMIIVTVVNGSYSFAIENSFNNISSVFDSIKTSNMYDYFGGKYFKGAISNNYVVYSGIVWRIMGKNYDGSIRLIADEPVTSLYFANGTSTISNFKETYAYEWLNDYFVSRLNYNDIIVKFEWCDAAAAGTSSAADSCKDSNKEIMNQAKVGLLSLDEYNLSKSSGTYINSDISFVTLTSNTSKQSYYNIYNNNATVVTRGSMFYIKPVINVKPTTAITDGNGSSSNPFILDKSVVEPEMTNRSLADINLSPGEYVKLGSVMYRVVDSDKSSTKLIRDSYINTTKYKIGTSPYFNTTTGIGKDLNETYFNANYTNHKKIIKASMWYQGSYGDTSYKYTSLSKSNFVIGSKEGVPVDVKVGLPKVGEILTIPINETEFWTMSLASASTVYSITKEKINSTAYTTALSVREVIIIDNNCSFVQGGIGTSSKPYIVVAI